MALLWQNAGAAGAVNVIKAGIRAAITPGNDKNGRIYFELTMAILPDFVWLRENATTIGRYPSAAAAAEEAEKWFAAAAAELAAPGAA